MVFKGGLDLDHVIASEGEEHQTMEKKERSLSIEP